jgi:hypothetical protein
VGKAADKAVDMAAAMGKGMAVGMISGGFAEDCMVGASMATDSGGCTQGSRFGSLSLQEYMDCRSWELS